MPEPEYSEACRRALEHRTQGRIPEAAAEINEVLEAHFDRGEVLRETLKLCLLTGEPHQAREIYHRLCATPGADDLMEGEFLARLKLELPDTDIPELDRDDLPWPARWVDLFLADGSDPPGDLVLQQVRLVGLGGNPSYRFTGDCAWCGATQETTVRTSFLVEREWICPACLGRQHLGFDGIKAFLLERYPDMTTGDVHRWDAEFICLQRELSVADPERGPFPRAAVYLNQQCVFQLSQLFTARLIEEER